MQATVRGRDHLSIDEARDALYSLEEDALCDVHSAAGRLAATTPSLGPQDLINQAVMLILDGRRHVPRDEKFVAVVIRVMQSAASHERAKAARMSPLGEFEHEACPKPSPEHVAELAELLRQVRGAFATDEAVSVILLAREDGTSLHEAAEILGIGASEMEAALPLAGAPRLEEAAMNKEQENRDAALLRRVAEDAVDDLLSTPRDIREQEIREDHDERSIAARTRTMIGDAIARHGKGRAVQLRQQMERRRSAERSRLRPMSVEEKRALYVRVANCNAADLTTAARDGREVADEDLDGHLEAWLSLGVIDEDGNLR